MCLLSTLRDAAMAASIAAKPVFCTLLGTINALTGFSVFVSASKSTLPMRPSSSFGQPKNSYRRPTFSVSVGDRRQSSARKTLKSLKRNRLSVMPNCVSASVARPRRSCVKLSNFSNSVACSSGRFVSNSLRRNSPPIRRACDGRGPAQRVAERPRALLAIVEAVVRSAERESLHGAAGPPNVVSEPSGGGAAVEKVRRVLDADALVGEIEERIIELAGVVEIEHSAAHLVDLVAAEDVRVGHGDGGVAVGAPQRERRRQARRIWKRIEAGNFA